MTRTKPGLRLSNRRRDRLPARLPQLKSDERDRHSRATFGVVCGSDLSLRLGVQLATGGIEAQTPSRRSTHTIRS